jgi:hypothetical protein
MRRLLALLVLVLGAAFPALAHEIRPAYLHIREIEAESYDVLWKTPAQGALRLALNVRLPENCRDVSAPRMIAVEGAALQSWRTICAGGLVGQSIGVDNLETSLTDVIVQYEPLHGAARTLRMDNAATQALIPAAQSPLQIAGAYFRLGLEHIAFGIDHLLFVFCLVMLVGHLGRLLGVITAFTLAHSMTLAATTFGWLRLSSAPVEACIALSIAFVAAEVLSARQGRTSLTQRWPWLAGLGFGLLHGFGFAAALHELGLPDGAVPLALLGFNLGVEAGQILFVFAVLSVMMAWGRLAPAALAWAWRVPIYGAGGLAAFWFVERAASIFL